MNGERPEATTTDQPRCHCGSVAIVRYKLKPYADRAHMVGLRGTDPAWVGACRSANHQQQAKDAGVVLATETLDDAAAAVEHAARFGR